MPQVAGAYGRVCIASALNGLVSQGVDEIRRWHEVRLPMEEMVVER